MAYAISELAAGDYDELKKRVAELRARFRKTLSRNVDNIAAGAEYPSSHHFADQTSMILDVLETAEREIKKGPDSLDPDFLQSALRTIEKDLPALEQFDEEKPLMISKQELLEQPAEDIDEKLPDFHFEGHTGASIGVHPNRKSEIERVMILREPQLVVECGSGAGENVDYIAEIIKDTSQDSTIVAFDLDRGYRNVFRKESPSHIKYFTGSVNNKFGQNNNFLNHIEDNAVDYILCTNVLSTVIPEFYHDEEKADKYVEEIFENMLRVCNPKKFTIHIETMPGIIKHFIEKAHEKGLFVKHIESKRHARDLVIIKNGPKK